MASPNIVIADAAGLQQQQNELTLPAGSLAVAENVEITRDGVIEVARGFEDFSDNLPDFTPEQLLVVGDTAYLNLDSGLWYFDNDERIWRRKIGVLGAKSTQPLFCTVLNGILFYTANKCVFGLDLSTGLIELVAGRFNVSGTADGTGDVARFTSPAGICSDGTSLYVFESAAVRKVSPPLTSGSGVVVTIAGVSGSPGSSDGTGSTARFTSGRGICFDGTNLYVADYGNNVIKKVAPPFTVGAAVVTTIAGTAGANGSTDATGAAARFDGPSGICFDGTNLFVTDYTNNTVRMLAPPLTLGAAVATTVAGTAGASGASDGTGSDARFNGPLGILFDGTNLFVTDSLNHSIRMLAPPLSSGAAAVTTPYGTSPLSGAIDGVGTDARFNFPYGIALDSGSLYVCELTNGIIRKIYQNDYVVTISGIAGLVPTSFEASADGFVAGPPE